MKKLLIILFLILPSALFSQAKIDDEIRLLKNEVQFVKQQLAFLEYDQIQNKAKDSIAIANEMEIKMLLTRLRRIENRVTEVESKIIGVERLADRKHSHGKSPSVAFGISLTFPGLGAFYADNKAMGIIEVIVEGLALAYLFDEPSSTRVNILIGIHLGQALINTFLVGQ